ncbi:MAG: M48 family metallopeptidase [Mediterranea sp.]|jgi:predicted metal-dependent hydrolase|nr:M48 family metallopeptidase [Mediterranea sp.]
MTGIIIEDQELGRIVAKLNPRAKRYVFRMKSDAIYLTLPPGTTREGMLKAIDDVRPRLLARRPDVPAQRLIDLSFTIRTEHFNLSLRQGISPRFLARSEWGRTEIICPPNANFADESLQTWLRKVIDEELRRNAKVILLPRLIALARDSGLKYAALKISSSHGRWGSCSNRGVINLSFYLLLLPSRLIDYVILHELCHTVEMNHSERFWALLNLHTDGRAHELRNELKSYRTTYDG